MEHTRPSKSPFRRVAFPEKRRFNYGGTIILTPGEAGAQQAAPLPTAMETVVMIKFVTAMNLACGFVSLSQEHAENYGELVTP